MGITAGRVGRCVCVWVWVSGDMFTRAVLNTRAASVPSHSSCIPDWVDGQGSVLDAHGRS